MALCCIGGVCIPYTAIIPLLIYGFQWLLQKLADLGLLPESLCQQLRGFMITIRDKPKDVGEDSCCSTKEKSSKTSNLRRGKQSKDTVPLSSNGDTESKTTDHGSTLTTIESPEDWEQSVATSDEMIVICKFTATWCKPCKEIQPLFESLSRTTNGDRTVAKFIVVDVDVLDDVASTYKVISLPTFISLQNGRVIDKYSGSSPDQLKKFVTSSLSVASPEH